MALYKTPGKRELEVFFQSCYTPEYAYARAVWVLALVEKGITLTDIFDGLDYQREEWERFQRPE